MAARKKPMYTLFCFRCIWFSPEHQKNKQNEPNEQNVNPGAESWMWLLAAAYSAVEYYVQLQLTLLNTHYM